MSTAVAEHTSTDAVETKDGKLVAAGVMCLISAGLLAYAGLDLLLSDRDSASARFADSPDLMVTLLSVFALSFAVANLAAGVGCIRATYWGRLVAMSTQVLFIGALVLAVVANNGAFFRMLVPLAWYGLILALASAGEPRPLVGLTHADELKILERREGWARRLPILPALIFTIVVTQIPFLFTLFYSLTEWRLDTPDPREFIGLENYGALPDDKFFRDAAWVSVQMTVLAVLLSLIVGTLLAILLDRKFFGQGFVRTLLITPFLVMPVVAGFMWKTQMFSSTFGVINWVIELFGFGPTEFATKYPMASVIVVLVWQWSPFMMLIVLAGLQGQDTSVLEAARVDGATTFGIFRQITFPQLRPFLELGTLLGAIYLIQVYDHIEVIVGGQPGAKNLPFYIAQRSIGGGNRFGLASSYSIVVVIASIIIANIGLRVLSNLLEDDS